MLDRFLEVIKQRFIPVALFRALEKPYHFFLAFCGALRYGFPSRKLYVIGVTGTKGKTTSCYLISEILNRAGKKTALSTSVYFGIGRDVWRNETKHAMPGRFFLQKFLRQAVRAGCAYAVIETSSEGILQYRHRFIDYDMAVFTNISPEHIERHGGFENYRNAKIKLFQRVARRRDGIGVYNLDDGNVKYFLKPEIAKKIGFNVLEVEPPREVQPPNINVAHAVSQIHLSLSGSSFDFDSTRMETPLLGAFNVRNIASAISAVLELGVPLETVKRILPEIQPPQGRFEIIEAEQGFRIIIDYAHEPASLKAVYEAADVFQPKRKICVLGAQGGGRDKWKRPEMGRIAAKYCDVVILTNEDPYDENPDEIIGEIKNGFNMKTSDVPKINRQYSGHPTSQILNRKIKKYWEIIDRREAIRKAISLARSGDVVILTGKGGETAMCVADGKRIPWDERKIVEKILGG